MEEGNRMFKHEGKTNKQNVQLLHRTAKQIQISSSVCCKVTLKLALWCNTHKSASVIRYRIKTVCNVGDGVLGCWKCGLVEARRRFWGACCSPHQGGTQATRAVYSSAWWWHFLVLTNEPKDFRDSITKANVTSYGRTQRSYVLP
jgi:hypothetical protein